MNRQECSSGRIGLPSILVVDDDEKDVRLLQMHLHGQPYEVKTVTSGEAALTCAKQERIDLILLDMLLPGIDGFEVLQRIRADSDVPVIMLTARSEEVDRVVGLTVGADDYVTKPFSPRELAARIRAVLRRGRRPGEEEVLRFPGLSIDLARREVLRDGEAVTLTTLEFDLLAALASGPGRVFTRDQLLQRVWGFDYFGVDRVVDVHVANIRKALGDDAADPAVVGTVRGVGYRFLLAPA